MDEDTSVALTDAMRVDEQQIPGSSTPGRPAARAPPGGGAAVDEARERVCTATDSMNSLRTAARSTARSRPTTASA
jgi:hypothetical protein